MAKSYWFFVEGTKLQTYVITAALYMHTNQQWAEYSYVIIRKRKFDVLAENKNHTHKYTCLVLKFTIAKTYTPVLQSRPLRPQSLNEPSADDSKDSVDGMVIILPSCVNIVITFPIACQKSHNFPFSTCIMISFWISCRSLWLQHI